MDYIGVLPHKKFYGVYSLNGPHIIRKGPRVGETFIPVAQERCSLEEALTRHWPSDAHCTCYWIEGEAQIPLITKGVLAELKAADKGPVSTAFMLDWDMPNHADLDGAGLLSFISGMAEAVKLFPELDNWYCWYTSKHGARIVYKPSKPVPVQEGERYVIGIIEMFKQAGMLLDEGCFDWTRRFRLPYVVRDGVDTTATCTYQPKGAVLDITKVRKASKGKLVFHKRFDRKGTHPTQEECEKRLKQKNPSSGHHKQTLFLAKAKKALKGSEWEFVLFSADTEFPADEGRNNTIGKVLGSITKLLIKQANATIEDIFALMYGPLCQWEADEGTASWHEHCWNFLQDIYEREIILYNAEKDKEADVIESVGNILDNMAEGMRKWDDSPDLESEDEEVRHEYVKHRLFVSLGSYFFPLLEDGTYSGQKLNQGQMISYAETCPLASVLEVKKQDAAGVWRYITSVEMQNGHSIPIQKSSAVPQLPSGGYVKGAGTQRPELVLPMYRRNPLLLPKYNEHVDGWLKALFGDHYEDACKWIGYSLAFEEGPICAMSLQGEGGTGKKLLVLGLSECLEYPAVAYAEAVSGTSQSILSETPFFVVNENWPKGKLPPADQFKAYTAGDDLPISEKYAPNTVVTNPLRVIFTANGHDLVYALTEGRTISPADRNAIGDRLYHVNVNEKAREYLRSIGGAGFTAKPGARWIRGDMKQESDYVVAKHFMWLYENRPTRNPQDRYCVMGNCGPNSQTSHRMMTRSVSVATVIKAIIGMSEKSQQYKDHLKVREDTRGLYVTEAGIHQYITTIMGERISDRDLTDGLQNVTSANPEVWDYRSFYEVDCGTVLGFATERGIDTPVIRGIKMEQGK